MQSHFGVPPTSGVQKLFEKIKNIFLFFFECKSVLAQIQRDITLPDDLNSKNHFDFITKILNQFWVALGHKTPQIVSDFFLLGHFVFTKIRDHART